MLQSSNPASTRAGTGPAGGGGRELELELWALKTGRTGPTPKRAWIPVPTGVLERGKSTLAELARAGAELARVGLPYRRFGASGPGPTRRATGTEGAIAPLAGKNMANLD